MEWKFEDPKKSGKYLCILRDGNKNIFLWCGFFVNKKEADSSFNNEPGWLYDDRGWNSLDWLPIETDYKHKSLMYTAKELNYKTFILCWLDMSFPNGIEVDNALFW